MTNRRSFLGLAAKTMTGFILFFQTGIPKFANALAEATKTILPKATRMRDLVSRDPAKLERSCLLRGLIRRRQTGSGRTRWRQRR